MGLGTAATVSLIIGAVGTGVSVYGQRQAAKTSAAIANYNAHQQEMEARTQLATMTAQAKIQEQQAEANYRLQQAEANARFQNAAKLESHALSQDSINRENLRKRQMDYQRMKGEQRAAISSSGLAESAGTPLDLLAEMATRIQQDQEEEVYTNELNRRTIFEEAAQERLGGQFALVGATLDRQSSAAESGLRSAAAQSQYRSGRAQAEMTRLAGRADAQAAKTQSYATLLSGANSGYDSYSRLKANSAKRTYRTS